MSATAVALTLPEEVLDRTDQHRAATGESRSEYMLSWLPAFYGDDWGAQPPSPGVTAAPTAKISISVPGRRLTTYRRDRNKRGHLKSRVHPLLATRLFRSGHRTGA